jgi:hypothetical protein
MRTTEGALGSGGIADPMAASKKEEKTTALYR